MINLKSINGVSLIDIEKVVDPYFTINSIVAMGANTIRLPVYPSNSPNLHLLNELVEYSKNLKLNIVIDNHEIADITKERVEAAKDFWSLAIDKLHDDAILLEIYNEPINTCTEYFDIKPIVSWNNYFYHMNDLAKFVRSKCNNTLLVGTPVFCGILSPSIPRPIEIDNMAYTAHLYPSDINPVMLEFPKLKQFHEYRLGIFDHIEKCSLNHEVVITEFGWNNDNDPVFMAKLDTVVKNYGWIAWVYDNDWKPPMLDKQNNLNDYGRYVEKLLKT